MWFFRRFLQGEIRLNRIEAFTDGVFAVIATLLLLELQVPRQEYPENVRELFDGLIDYLPKFLSWLISLVIVAKFWLNHHHVLGLARHANYALVWINSIFLLTQFFVPFPTAMMGEYPTNPLAVSLFGCVISLNTVIFLVLHWYIVRYLIKPELHDQHDPSFIRQAMSGPASYLLGAAAAWVSIYLAFIIYMITPLFYIVPVGGTPRPESTLSKVKIQ
jgi:uncharacterized membrane protein